MCEPPATLLQAAKAWPIARSPGISTWAFKQILPTPYKAPAHLLNRTVNMQPPSLVSESDQHLGFFSSGNPKSNTSAWGILETSVLSV